MNMKKLLGAAAIGVLSLSVLLAGCSKSNQGGSSAKKANELVVAQAANPTTMDPHDTQDTLAYGIQETMYEGLLGFDKDMKVVPVLADGMPTLAPDAKSVTFKLKQGVKFQDGTDFNAEAVKINIERLKNPDNKLKRASLVSTVDKVEVVDPYTVKILLNKPFAAIIQTFAHPGTMMISPKAIKEIGKDLNRRPVGTGPFQFVEWKDGQYVVVKKYDGYWNKDKAAKVDKITFKPVVEAGSRVAMLKTGEVQFIYPLPSEQVDNVKGDANIVVDKAPSIIERYIVLNVTQKPLDDKRVRQALNYAVDNEALTKVVYKGLASPASSAIAPNVWGFQKQQMYTRNVEKAKQLLAEAGYPDGFEITLWAPNDTERAKIAEFVQQQWQAIGVKAKIQQMEFVALTNQLSVKPSESKLQAAVNGWSPSTGEADWGIRPLLTKDMFPTAGFNTGFYTNDSVEGNIQTGLTSANEKDRLDAYAAAQKTIVEDAPWVFLVVPDNVAGKRKNLTGVYVLPDATLSVSGAAFQ